MANSKNTTKMDSLVKLMLVFFISLLSFSIGTFVGKKFSDNQHKLASLESNEPRREVASIPHDAASVKPSQVLSDEQIAKMAEEFVSDDPTIEKAPESPAQATETVVAAREPNSAPAQDPHLDNAANQVAAGQAPSMPKPTAEAKAKELPQQTIQSAVGKFTVQLASYPTEGEAQKMAADLKSKGFSAFYMPANVKGQNWYRVSVGLFSTQKEAQEYKGQVMEKAKVSSAIVQKITN